MMPTRLVLLIAIISLWGITPAFAESSRLTVTSSDSIMSILKRHEGKTVTVRFFDGKEMTGKIAGVGSQLVHFEALPGGDYFDAVAAIHWIEAIITRAKEAAPPETEKK